jgi:hypothetical protein
MLPKRSSNPFDVVQEGIDCTRCPLLDVPKASLLFTKPEFRAAHLGVAQSRVNAVAVIIGGVMVRARPKKVVGVI